MPLLTPTLNGSEDRRFADSYFTPEAATEALLPHLALWPKLVWEPACGDGAITRVLERRGYQVISSDLHNYGGRYHSGVEFDFLNAPIARAKTLITNPPFNEAVRFIAKAKALKVERMALLLKADFFNSLKGKTIWELWAPTNIFALTWRLDFTGAGAPHTNCMWVIWEKQDYGNCPACHYRLLERPRLTIG